MKIKLLIMSALFFALAFAVNYLIEVKNIALPLLMVGVMLFVVSLFVKKENKDLEFDNPNIEGANKTVNKR